jgi:hypothetical protein
MHISCPTIALLAPALISQTRASVQFSAEVIFPSAKLTNVIQVTLLGENS